MAHLDGDLGLIVRGGSISGNVSSLFNADSSGASQLQSLRNVAPGDMPSFQRLSSTTSKCDSDTGSKTSWSGASSPSSVLPCNSHLLLNDPKYQYRSEEILNEVINSLPGYGNQNLTSSSYYPRHSGTNSKESARIPFQATSQTDFDHLVPSTHQIPPELLPGFKLYSRNYSGSRDELQMEQELDPLGKAGFAMNRLDQFQSESCMTSLIRPRRTPRGPGLGEVGRQINKVSQETIQEDFFHGGFQASFAQRGTSGQCGPGSGADSISSDPLSASETSCHSSPGRNEPCIKRARGPVKKVEHNQASVVKVEDNSDEQVSPGGPGKTPKRRKNQQKRVVCVPVAASGRPTSESLPSDLWAWRKYGQKPIKGSPYPRGYYRCSTSKGCTARKQVERSRTDPSMLIITYTADHDHPWRSNRSTLPGSARLTPGLDHNGGSSGSHQIDTIEEVITDAEGSLGSSIHSPELGAADESSESTTAEMTEAQVPDLSEIDMMEAQVPEDLIDPAVFMSREEGMIGDSGGFDLSGHPCVGITGIQEQDDLFAELGELPESHFLFGKLGLIEDRPDDECEQLLGMDNQSDAFNLFSWDSAPSTAHPSSGMH